MSNIPNHMKIAIIEIKDKLSENAPIEERLKNAMRLALNHWLVIREEEQFRCAVGAVLLTTSDEEKRIILNEMQLIKGLSSAHTGVPVNFELLLDQANVKKVYGLIKIWKEIKKEKQ